MNENVGKTDKVLRIIAGVIIIGAGIYWQSWWGAIGIVPILTALLSWCPAYTLLGINSCGTHKP